MKSTNIFRAPSFLKGFARTLDLFGKLDSYKYSTDPDSELIKKDWNIIAKDLKDSLNRYGKKSYS